MKETEIVGKKIRVNQADQIEGIATVKRIVMTDKLGFYDYFCEVEFEDEPGRTYRRWVKVGDLL